MAGNRWRGFCAAKDLEADGEQIRVRFADGRSHLVRVEDLADAFHLEGTVLRRSEVEAQPEISVRTWLMNRRSGLVGFKIDSRRRLVGTAWVPTAGLTASEFCTYVREVAKECDRLEFALTGRDQH